MIEESTPSARAGGMAGFDRELAGRLGSFLKRSEQALLAAKTAALAPYNLTVPQYSALLLLDFVPEASAAQLSRACLVTPQTMAAVVDKLEEKRFVAREPSPLHRRVLAVRLTDEGRSVLRAADHAARAVEQRLLAGFTPAEAEQLRSLLDRATEILRTSTPGS
jgi:DNA-binding MarR family transcriptional regulator